MKSRRKRGGGFFSLPEFRFRVRKTITTEIKWLFLKKKKNPPNYNKTNTDDVTSFSLRWKINNISVAQSASKDFAAILDMDACNILRVRRKTRIPTKLELLFLFWIAMETRCCRGNRKRFKRVVSKSAGPQFLEASRSADSAEKNSLDALVHPTVLSEFTIFIRDNRFFFFF